MTEYPPQGSEKPYKPLEGSMSYIEAGFSPDITEESRKRQQELSEKMGRMLAEQYWKTITEHRGEWWQWFDYDRYHDD